MVRTGDRTAVRSLAAALIPIPPEVTDGSGPSSPRPNTTSYPIPTGLLASASKRTAAQTSRIYFDTSFLCVATRGRLYILFSALYLVSN